MKSKELGKGITEKIHARSKRSGKPFIPVGCGLLSKELAASEHLRKLSLGFLSRRDPGDLSSMLITDFMMAETGISHHLPQLMGAIVMPVLAFVSLVWIDWRMAVSMFAALPFAMLVLWASTKAQRGWKNTCRVFG